MRFKVPELFLGSLLTVALFAIGFVAAGGRHSHADWNRWAFLEKTLDDPIAAFTAVLAISTSLLWFATFKASQRQSEETRILQRAYISVEPQGTRLAIDNARIFGHVVIKNAGNLPATNVSWQVKIKQSGLRDDRDFPLGETRGNGFLAPHSETVRGSSESLIVQDLLLAAESTPYDRSKERPLYIYVWGVVRYHDGFVAGRSTTFCHRYNWISRNADGYEIDKLFGRQHTHGNATD